MSDQYGGNSPYPGALGSPGIDTVTIPRAEYEALMAARRFVDKLANYDWTHYGDKGARKEMQREAASVDAALRAAGIPEGGG